MYAFKSTVADREPGDILYRVKDGELSKKYWTIGKCYIFDNSGKCKDDKDTYRTPSISNKYWQIVKTKPGIEAKAGDKVIFIAEDIGGCEQGKVYSVDKLSKNKQHIYWNTEGNSRYATEFLVLCEPEKDSQYPLLRRHRDSDMVVEFTALTEGIVVIKGASARTVGFHQRGFTKHTDKRVWGDVVEPKFKVGDAITIPDADYHFGTVIITHIDSSLYYYQDDLGKTGNSPISLLELTTHLVPIQEHSTMIHQEQLNTQLYEGAEMPGSNSKTFTLEVKDGDISVAKHHAAACLTPKTDLETKLPFCMVAYEVDGSYGKSYYNKTSKGLLKRKDEFLQKAENLGKTVTLHERFGIFTTAVPVVEVKEEPKKKKKNKNSTKKT